LFYFFKLSPVSFLHYVPAVAVNPAVRDPVRTGMRWAIIVTANPYVARAIPAVISRNPLIAGAGTWSWMLNHGDGRSDAHNYLRVCSNWQQTQSEQSCKNSFSHGYILPLFIDIDAVLLFIRT